MIELLIERFLESKTAMITFIIASILAIAVMSFKLYESEVESERLSCELTKTQGELKTTAEKLVLVRVNNETLKAGIGMQNAKLDAMAIDLEKAKKQYKIKEVEVIKTVVAEQQSVADLNETEDCKKAKEIADEILELL